MRFRKLRIAWSVFWGLACLLLIELWVRSYFFADTVYGEIPPVLSFTLNSYDGQLSLEHRPKNQPWGVSTQSRANGRSESNCCAISRPHRIGHLALKQFQ